MDEALHDAESCRGPYEADPDVDALSEEILLAAGRVEETYACCGRAAWARRMSLP